MQERDQEECRHPRWCGEDSAFSLNGSASDIAVAFVLIIGTWGYSWLLNGVRLGWFAGGTAKA